ncbi:hypothetical protein ACTQ6A_09685 [Lachnospiraceae bacterium LCP25S3_G4]
MIGLTSILNVVFDSHIFVSNQPFDYLQKYVFFSINLEYEFNFKEVSFNE